MKEGVINLLHALYVPPGLSYVFLFLYVSTFSNTFPSPVLFLNDDVSADSDYISEMD